MWLEWSLKRLVYRKTTQRKKIGQTKSACPSVASPKNFGLVLGEREVSVIAAPGILIQIRLRKRCLAYRRHNKICQEVRLISLHQVYQERPRDGGALVVLFCFHAQNTNKRKPPAHTILDSKTRLRPVTKYLNCKCFDGIYATI